ncbi:MAG: FAD-dependent oxidoreductase, partial [Spirochaetaceae bacterium]|nr:FAD-dependent oxidoreductase [Spirochaetaceae bacterium]
FLEEEMMKKRWRTGLLSVLLILAVGFMGCSMGESEKVVYRDRETPGSLEFPDLAPGSYTGIGQGWHGEVEVTVVVSEHYIESVSVGTSFAAGNPESANIGRPATQTVSQRIVDFQSTNVDVVSGASFSSLAVMAAVRDCIEQAGGTDKMLAYDARTTPITIRGNPETFGPDVIVVGGGLGGVYAAMRVADMGGKALLIEQAPHLGGSSRFAAGAYAGAEMPGQPVGWTDATIPNYKNYLKTVNTGVNGFNEAASAAYVENIPPATQKLIDWGMVVTTAGFNRLAGTEKTEGDANTNTAGYFMRQGNALFADITPRMNRYINAGSLGYILNNKVVDLIMEGGRVVGVRIEGGRTYRAGAVIMATGGYSCNGNILSIPDPDGPGINYWTISSSTTDIGNMTEVLMKPPYNATTYRLDQVRFDGGVLPMVPPGDPYRLKIAVPYGHGNASGTPYKRIFLNKNGERFINESLGADSGGTHSPTDFLRWDGFRKAPDQLVWVLGSGAKPSLTDGELGPSEPSALNGNGNRAWWQAQVDAGNYIWESDNGLGSTELEIKDLATRAGLNPVTVWNTLVAYNGYCDDGDDPDWERPVAGLLKMDAGPFWMVKTSGHIKGTLGGLDLTAKAEVPNASGPIPGLYAAGEIGGNVAYTGTIWLVGFNLSAEASFGEIAAGEALTWSRNH